MYLKIFNEDENHHGFQYQDGLNVDVNEFDNDKELKMKIKLELQYTCGVNHTTFFTVIVDSQIEPEVLNLKVGDEIEMGDYGTLPESTFFESDIHEHAYDEKYDHNILKVVEIRTPIKTQVTAQVKMYVTMEVDVFAVSKDFIDGEELTEAVTAVMDDTGTDLEHKQIVEVERGDYAVVSHASMED